MVAISQPPCARLSAAADCASWAFSSRVKDTLCTTVSRARGPLFGPVCGRHRTLQHPASHRPLGRRAGLQGGADSQLGCPSVQPGPRRREPDLLRRGGRPIGRVFKPAPCRLAGFGGRQDLANGGNFFCQFIQFDSDGIVGHPASPGCAGSLWSGATGHSDKPL